MNSSLTGPTDGTLPADAEAISGINNKIIKTAMRHTIKKAVRKGQLFT